MLRIRTSLTGALVFALLLFAGVAPRAAAQTLTATLQDIAFKDTVTGDPASLSGSFDYDPFTGTISRISVTLSVPSLGLSEPLQLQAPRLLLAPSSDLFFFSSMPCNSTDCTTAQISLNPGPAAIPGSYQQTLGEGAGYATARIVSNGVSQSYFGGTTGGSIVVTAQGDAGTLHLVSPFLLENLAGADPTNLDLHLLLSEITDWGAVTANGLSADNASAVIGVYQVPGLSDVKFQTTDGTSLLLYYPHFLTGSPIIGPSQTLTVPYQDLIDVQGKLYAAVLIQAPNHGVARSFPGPVTVTASGPAGYQGIATMQLVPPPVILVHGLWGSSKSLRYTQAFLKKTPPWSAGGIVDAIQYPQFPQALAFDDPAVLDVLVTHVDNALDTLNYDAQIVGGRVDIVAHSMGGLVARHFASFNDHDNYFDTDLLRDRGLGKIREIVTLDTPEQGSALAPFLLGVADYRRRAPLTSRAGFFFNLLCGKRTVAACYEHIKKPILGPDGTTVSGAVYSVSPGYPGLNPNNVAETRIPNALWRAVSAQVAPDHSAIEFANDLTIAALYPPDAAEVPTTESILGGQPNDAIVALPSQIAEALPGEFYTFDGLSHTDLGPLLGGAIRALGLNLGLSARGVIHDDNVNQLVGNWLVNADQTGAGANAPRLPAEPATEAGEPVLPLSSARFIDRILLEKPRGAKLAQPLQLALKVPSPGLLRALFLDQSDERGHSSETQELTNWRIDGDTVHVTAVPRLLGSVTFTVTAAFEDGGIGIREAAAEVRPPAEAPELFVADASFRKLRLQLSPGRSVYDLHPEALYSGIPERVKLDAASVDYSVLPGGNSVVALRGNPNTAFGVQVITLAPGEATVEARFGSAVDYLNVIVKPPRR